MSLSAANTYTGVTTISGGVLSVATIGNGGVAGNLGAATSAAANLVLNNGTLRYTGANASTNRAFTITTGATGTFDITTNNLTISGASASTTGALTKTGAGTLTLSGANTYTGVTTISNGTLSAGNIVVSSGNSHLGNAASAVVLGDGTNTGTLSYTGSAANFLRGLTVTSGGGGGNLTNNTGNLLQMSTGGTAVGSGSTMTFRATGAGGITVNSSSVISGDGNVAVNSSGAGVVTFSGDNLYTGTTGITAGTLRINGNQTSATGAVTVSSTATLGGSGTIGGAVTVNAGGFHAAGNSIGTQTMLAGYTQNGTEQVELGTPGANPADGVSDLTAVTGALNLGGASTLQLINNAGAGGNGSMGAGAYGLITFTGTRTGTFNSVTNPLSATLHEKVVYNGTSNGSVDLEVYRLATANTITTPVTLANVRVGGTFGTSALSIQNTASADGFSEGLNATQGSTTGSASVSGTDISNLAAGSSSSTISVGLGGAANTGTAGAKTGTVAIGLASNGSGTSGYGTTALSGQSITVNGSVFNAAVANTIATPVALNNVRVGGTFGTSALTISNTAAAGAFTEGLNATQGATTGQATVGGTNISNLAGGASSSTILVGLGGAANTGTAGAKTGTVAIGFASSGTNSGLADLALAGQTITVNGSVFNAAVANTISTPVTLTKIRVGDAFGTSALTISNTAAAGAFTEGLNATQGATTGDASVSGTNISNLAGGSSSSTISVGLAGANTTTSGIKSGTVDINLASSGTNSGLADLALSSQVITVTGTVYDYASASFTGDAGLTGGGLSYTYDFGTLTQFDLANTTLNLANLPGSFRDALGGAFSYTGAAQFTDLTGAISQFAAGGSDNYLISFDTSTIGTFSGTLTFNGLSQQTGLSDAALSAITVDFTGVVVPEPHAALLGAVGLMMLLRRRR